MSLKFLAVGRSLAGIRGEKSPYELKKENQLPTFGGSPKFAGRQSGPEEQAMVQTDFLQEAQAPQADVVAEPAINPFASKQSASPAPEQVKRRRSWWSFFGLKWFRAQPSREEMIQSELSLEKIRVMRNDLADSDLQLVLKKKKKAKPVFSATQENNGISKQGWSELTARLFEIGQK